MLKVLIGLCLLLAPARVLPAREIVLGGQRLKVKLMDQQDFNGVVNEWRYGGRGRVWVQHGHLQMDATGVESTAWFTLELKGNLLITYEARILPPAGKKNINLIFLASAPGGGDVLKLYFTGQYSEYKNIPNYIWTFDAPQTRLRRNPGFLMVSENKKVLPEPGKTYHLAVTTWNGLIRCFIDGELIHSYQDPHPHTRGKLAFRSWHTRLWWDNLRVYKLLEVTTIRSLNSNLR
ncbi:MAG: DUF6250 domain-containing protein [Terriglobia bacterium]